MDACSICFQLDRVWFAGRVVGTTCIPYMYDCPRTNLHPIYVHLLLGGQIRLAPRMASSYVFTLLMRRPSIHQTLRRRPDGQHDFRARLEVP
jgi:hypothetical protein